MNFLGIDVRGLPVATGLAAGKVIFAVAYLTWVVVLYRSRKVRDAWFPVLLALLTWLAATYPLQRLYGLEAGMDRLRNLSWCATAAAGNPPWESGVVGQKNLEPAWVFLVSTLALHDPARVMKVYPFLPALAIALLGASFLHAFRKRSDTESTEREADPAPLRALLVVFLILLAPTGPLDHLSPYRGFWQRTFLLKPNHALGFALLPLFVSLVSGRKSVKRSAAAAVVLGALGWVFVVHWALACSGVVFYAACLVVQQRERWRAELPRLGLIVLISAVLVAPYLHYLVKSFPVVSFPSGVYPDDPQRSVWGDTPPRTHSLLFLATLDLGPNFLLACYGMWTCWSRRRRFGLLWFGLALSACAAWGGNAALLSLGQARETDEIYFFLVVMTAVQAALGLEALVDRLSRPGATDSAASGPWTRPRITAALLLLWFPLTLPWWWNPLQMDSHFRMSLAALPERLTSLGSWIRSNSAGDDIFFAGADVAVWIPALTGRRVLRTGMPWLGTEAYRDECRILFPESPEEAEATLGRLGVDYVVVDASLLEEHVLEPDHLDRHPSFRMVFETRGIKVYRPRAHEPTRQQNRGTSSRSRAYRPSRSS